MYASCAFVAVLLPDGAQSPWNPMALDISSSGTGNFWGKLCQDGKQSLHSGDVSCWAGQWPPTCTLHWKTWHLCFSHGLCKFQCHVFGMGASKRPCVFEVFGVGWGVITFISLACKVMRGGCYVDVTLIILWCYVEEPLRLLLIRWCYFDHAPLLRWCYVDYMLMLRFNTLMLHWWWCGVRVWV